MRNLLVTEPESLQPADQKGYSRPEQQGQPDHEEQAPGFWPFALDREFHMLAFDKGIGRHGKRPTSTVLCGVFRHNDPFAPRHIFPSRVNNQPEFVKAIWGGIRSSMGTAGPVSLYRLVPTMEIQ